MAHHTTTSQEDTMDTQVAIVQRISECDVRELPDMRMPYSDALDELRALPAKYRRQFDLIAVRGDGTLGRYVSWAL